MRNRYRTAVLAACGAFVVTQAAAGLVSAQRPASAEEVTISVSNLPPSTEAGAREAFLERVEEFEAQYPNITLEPDEYEWDVATFGAQLAGGTLPTVFQIPFTDIAGAASSAARSRTSPPRSSSCPTPPTSTPTCSTVAQDADGRHYGVPIAGYGIGLHYNRALFEEAGLDPDAPPTTWAEVREARPRRSPRPPARPASPRCRRTTPAAGC